ncbi:hypothetical protein J3F83DRAFT_732437 [Trichoderma novae-zelandiae]
MRVQTGTPPVPQSRPAATGIRTQHLIYLASQGSSALLGYWTFGSICFDWWARPPLQLSCRYQAGDAQSGTTAVGGLLARQGLSSVASNRSANHEPRAASREIGAVTNNLPRYLR